MDNKAILNMTQELRMAVEVLIVKIKENCYQVYTKSRLENSRFDVLGPGLFNEDVLGKTTAQIKKKFNLPYLMVYDKEKRLFYFRTEKYQPWHTAVYDVLVRELGLSTKVEVTALIDGFQSKLLT